MKLTEKLNHIQTNHMGDWLKTRREVFDELSEKQSLLCVCKRLATGFHENSCRTFQKKVTSETMKRLTHLITNLDK